MLFSFCWSWLSKWCYHEGILLIKKLNPHLKWLNNVWISYQVSMQVVLLHLKGFCLKDDSNLIGQRTENQQTIDRTCEWKFFTIWSNHFKSNCLWIWRAPSKILQRSSQVSPRAGPLTNLIDEELSEKFILYTWKYQLQNFSMQKIHTFLAYPINHSVYLHWQILLFILYKAKTC